MPESERIHALDNLRAAAMFLGIVLHAGMTFMSFAPLPYRDVKSHEGYDLLFMAIHGFRMHLFFFIAGFFARLLRERCGSRAFLKQRFKRIGLPLIFGWPLFVLPTLTLIIWGAATLNPPENVAIRVPAGVEPRGFPLAHLWFLQFLLVMYPSACFATWIGGRMQSLVKQGDRLFIAIIRSPFRIIAFSPLTILCLWNGPIWGEPEVPGISAIPEPRALAHYALFFAAGWWMHRCRSELHTLTHWIGGAIPIALAAFGVHLSLLILNPAADSPNYIRLKVLSLACAATFAWAMTFAMCGLFLRFGNQANRRLRYLADASYWCYLAHLPFVVALQVMIAQWNLPGLLKVAFIVVATMSLLLIVYEYRVRYTWVGRLLNGPRVGPPRLTESPALVKPQTS